MNLIKALLSIIILIIMFVCLLYGANEEQAIRETPLDRKVEVIGEAN